MATGYITKEEAEKLRLLRIGRRSRVRALIEAMNKGQLLRIEARDFKWKKKSPGTLCRQLEKNTGKKFTVMNVADGGGWVVERVE